MPRKMSVDPQTALMVYKETGSVRKATARLAEMGIVNYLSRRPLSHTQVWYAITKTAEGAKLLSEKARRKDQARVTS